MGIVVHVLVVRAEVVVMVVLVVLVVAVVIVVVVLVVVSARISCGRKVK